MESSILEGTQTNLKLQVQRVIKATRQRVFDAWTKPELIRQWFGPGDMTTPKAEADLHVGGAYRIEMKGAAHGHDASHTAVASGVYREIVPNERLSFSWYGDWFPDEETLVTVELKYVDGGTEVTLTHERFASEVSMGKHEHGWNGSLEKLARLCEN